MKTSKIIERKDITEEVILFISSRVKEYSSECDIATLGLYPKVISRAIVEIVHSSALSQHPLDYKRVTSLVTDLDASTIYRIVDKR